MAQNAKGSDRMGSNELIFGFWGAPLDGPPTETDPDPP